MKKTAKIMKSIAIAIAATWIVNSGYAQDTRFTQEYNAPLRLNPALMGPNTDLKGLLSYRTQWANIAKGYTTYRFTFLYPLIISDQGKLDIGLCAFNDVAGAFSTLNISLALSYSLQIAEAHNLSAGLIGGFGQKSLDLADQTFDKQYELGTYDAGNPTGENLANEQKSYPDLGAGVLWNFKPDKAKFNAFAGFATYHHNSPDESFIGGEYDFPILANFHGGLKIIGDKFDFTPNLRTTWQDGAEEYSVGCYIDYKLNENMKIPAGLWYRYRNQDAFAIMLGFEHKNFVLAYSYDLGSFSLIKAIPNTMTHEITLGFMIDRQKDKGSKALIK